MNRPLLFGLLAIAAACVFIRKYDPARYAKVPAEEAAAKLRQAWADHHTSA